MINYSQGTSEHNKHNKMQQNQLKPFMLSTKTFIFQIVTASQERRINANMRERDRESKRGGK